MTIFVEFHMCVNHFTFIPFTTISFPSDKKTTTIHFRSVCDGYQHPSPVDVSGINRAGRSRDFFRFAIFPFSTGDLAGSDICCVFNSLNANRGTGGKRQNNTVRFVAVSAREKCEDVLCGEPRVFAFLRCDGSLRGHGVQRYVDQCFLIPTPQLWCFRHGSLA